jgi:hypothetical protein
MEDSFALDFERVFNQSAACLLMRADETQVTIVAVSDKYLQLTATRREDLVGRNPFDIFPDEAEHPDGAVSTRRAILEVKQSRKPVVIPDYLYPPGPGPVLASGSISPRRLSAITAEPSA